MAIDLNNLLANIVLGAYPAEFPAGSIFELRSGAPPGAENAASGTLIASIELPTSPWTTPASGSVSKNNTWSGVAVAANGGGAMHYRLKNAADTRREEGTVTAAGGGGDAIIDNMNIAIDQVVTVTTFTRTS